MSSEVLKPLEERCIGTWIGNHPHKQGEQLLLQIEPKNVAALLNLNPSMLQTWSVNSDKIVFNQAEVQKQFNILFDTMQSSTMHILIDERKVELNQTKIDSQSYYHISGNIKGLDYFDHPFQCVANTFASVESMINDSTILFNVFKQNGNAIAQNCNTSFGKTLEAGNYYMRIFQKRSHANKNIVAAYQLSIHLFQIAQLQN